MLKKCLPGIMVILIGSYDVLVMQVAYTVRDMSMELHVYKLNKKIDILELVQFDLWG